MVNALDAVFARCREEDRAALVAYLPAGYPDLEASLDAFRAVAESGADIVEVGVPYTDPLMDGPVIQRAAEQALASGFRFAQVLDVVRAVREAGAVPALTAAGFNPPASAVLDGKVLDVNKIHFVLASEPDAALLVSTMERRVQELSREYELPSVASLRERYSQPHRYDTPEVAYLKRVLQRGLPLEARTRVVDELFARFVSQDEAAFAAELYVSLEQLRCMVRHGMFVGSHSYDHLWLDSLPPDEQERQVVRSLEFLEQVGVDGDRWVMCYPYGGYNESLLEVLGRHGCAAGLTTEVALADLRRPLELARIDTNDLPKSADAPANEWTAAA